MKTKGYLIVMLMGIASKMVSENVFLFTVPVISAFKCFNMTFAVKGLLSLNKPTPSQYMLRGSWGFL